MTCSTASPASLPSPDDRPEAAVVLYDGQCGICTDQVRKLPWWDCQGKLSYLSLHDPRVAERYPELPHERLMEEMVVIDPSGRRHAGAYAVRYLVTHLRRLWWLAPLFYIPGGMLVWKPLYRWIAKNRYRFSGSPACEGGTCGIHGGNGATSQSAGATPRKSAK